MANSDRIQEALATPPIEVDHAQAEWAKGNLTVLAALLNIENDDNSFSELFQALNAVFAFDRALVLEDAGDSLHCIAAEPATLVGRHWPDKSLRDAPHVRAMPAGGARDAQDGQHLLSELAGSEEPALCLPIGVSGRPALLVLLRAQGADDFSGGHVAAARQCAAVALATLAACRGSQLEAEMQQLNLLIEQTCLNEQSAQQECRLFKEIIDHLPISLTVQDDNGRFILANAMAAANLATPAEVLIGASPADFLSEQEAASRHEWEQNVISQGKTITVEGNVSNQHGQRTWLTSHKPVRILDRTLLISS